MKPTCLLRAILVVASICGCFCVADGQLQPLPQSGVQGFVFCPASANDQPVPLYVGNCKRRQIGTVNCGEKVEVLRREEDMLRISLGETGPRGQRRTNLVAASSISRVSDKFVAFDDQSGVPTHPPDCSEFLARENAPEGFVHCSPGHDEEPVYFNACQSHPSGSIACGEELRVLGRQGDMLQVTAPPNGLRRYIEATAVSQQADKFVAFGDDSGVPDKGAPDCSLPNSNFGLGGGISHGPPDRNVTPPRGISQPDPEYTELARKKKIQGTVMLSFTVGIDGATHDITVEKGVGYGLDEKAVDAVRRWKFEPATKDGQPIEKQVKAEVYFHLY